ncbi:nuclear transport factor 2 family protein [Planomonospora sp. ID67723]|uniref:nuclear transport factor 2 family protein n=1 Tax=Planomonospora sp. ID67723 TaxID=2738134 RepID=UPI0018C3F782|nr:nuclear transport factor 2 family protein [Planomonospora sp. ID67723]MBG0826679.1 nuclear transport factor 2 family protein [Planomonospora sp. ID67723]
MSAGADTEREKRFHDFLTRLPHELGLGREDPAEILDRYYTCDIEYHNDGIRLDRDRLIAHVGPARRNGRGLEIEVHDAMVRGDRAAARYTLRAVMRTGKRVEMEIHLFARFASDGRIRRVDSITRTVPQG